MTAMVNVHEAKTHLSKLLERAHDGRKSSWPKRASPTLG